MAARSILSSARISSLLPTKDKLLGTERLLLESNRLLLQKAYGDQLASGDFDVLTTSINTSVNFLDNHNFWNDMSRDNDISYYKVGRGKKGVDPVSGEEFSFQKQGNGYRFCVPRTLVSLNEKRQFSGMMLQKAVVLLRDAMEASKHDAFLGASIFMEDDLESLEHQLQEAAKAAPGAFCIMDCDDAEKVEKLKEILLRNEKRMVRLSKPNTVGRMIKDDYDSEVGFDIPALVIRDGKVDKLI
mmetsp:Transcript_11096/g.16818  ORF Transcript_11096/g.16818 Transcript_11096/m.16818 type:complete len:243 (-) Transcript_11096:36-764(-)|eukprot:CAMPEP_0194074406 /NCGR_PEP_ID=MMETSP0149-20130528/1551_1 /TAXON_ID=122233 /ORGANISM="Chaetoceros debilis, Strain MM31A-1" /LENGTH=242 /DNA_ID=CAMNT_0038754595 /DNA_START=33 /DNA_END=761 /DNA_ORIENTATION=-